MMFLCEWYRGWGRGDVRILIFVVFI